MASEVASEYADGVWLVSLDSLSEGRQVERQIVLALGLKEEPERLAAQILTDYLRHKRLLLVLDNCEHLLDASAQVAAHLLRDCAGVRILATSREALGITGEAAWSVPGLTVPDLALPPPFALRPPPSALPHLRAECESVQLFVERAQAVNPDFALTPSSAPAVAQVCARLEGIPLAIELAAARVRVLTAEQIAARLDNHLSLLTGGSRASLPRQQTLRATLDWSYDLLSLPSRLLLARLSVFVGGWTLEAAEQVCAGGEIASAQVLDLLTGLVEKSLVAATPMGKETRYRFLETVRQYAVERLAESGEADAVRDRHLSWCVALAEEAEPHLRGAEQVLWLGRLEADHDNLRAGLSWFERQPAGAEEEAAGAAGGLHLAGALWRFWWVRGHLSEGRGWLGRALSRPGNGSPEDGTAETEAAAARAKALRGTGVLAWAQGDLAEAWALLEESLSLMRQLSDQRSIAIALGNLGSMARDRGNFAEARALLTECLGICRQLGNQDGIAEGLEVIAGIALGLGQPERAAWLGAAGAASRQNIGSARSSFSQKKFETMTAGARAALGEAAFAAAEAAGRAMTLDEAVRDALEKV